MPRFSSEVFWAQGCGRREEVFDFLGRFDFRDGVQVPGEIPIIPDAVRESLDFLEGIPEELKIADELAEIDVRGGIEAEPAAAPHVGIDDPHLLPMLDRPGAEPGPLGELADGEEFVAPGVFRRSVPGFRKAEFFHDLLDLFEAVTDLPELLQVKRPVGVGGPV